MPEVWEELDMLLSVQLTNLQEHQIILLSQKPAPLARQLPSCLIPTTPFWGSSTHLEYIPSHPD